MVVGPAAAATALKWPTLRGPVGRGALGPGCRRADGNLLEGVHAESNELVQKVLSSVPELASWPAWYRHLSLIHI